MNPRSQNTPVCLCVGQRAVTSPFGLIGTDENSLSFALGYSFQQCVPMLQWFLKEIGIHGIRKSTLRKASIVLQRHRTGECGITDVEIHLPGHFHVIIEAKVRLEVPTLEQCAKYVPYLEDEPIRKLVAVVQAPNDLFVNKYADDKPAFRGVLESFNWSKLFPECIRIMMGNSVDPEARAWVRSFYRFLDQEYEMKAFSTEVWIVAINTEPIWPKGLSHWEIHQKHRVWWDYREHAVRPLYLGFRVDGKLEAIGRVSKIEHGIPITDMVPEMCQSKNPLYQEPCTIWHFEPLVTLPTPIRTGRGMYNRRVRCDLDLLLTCETVQAIEQAMKKRRARSQQ